ncbi:MAG: thioredoxin domain-containing protein [Planctomycetota bacterium]|nr:thioredoxin domain-containing protein [Planctomycetota bacterium]
MGRGQSGGQGSRQRQTLGGGFGAGRGCRPCDMLQPILATLREKYDGKANILFVPVREEQDLGARSSMRSIRHLFFDKDGKEVERHTGFMPQEQLEQKLRELGVK